VGEGQNVCDLVAGARRARVAVVIVVAAGALGGCRSKSSEFYSRIFPCDIAATRDVCGTTQDGQPMICHSVSQLAGTDFCAPACDPDATSPEGSVCIGEGARVETCSPTASASDPAFGCPAGLSCYRTDLLHDEGLCLNMPVCKTSDDCPAGNKRRLCGGDLIGAMYQGLPLALDNFYCLQAGCKTTGSDCPPGESCLPIVVPSNAIPDICVPNCDENYRCPPNYVCSYAVSGPAAPKVCLPGLPGNRCAGPQDCLLGTCEDTNVGFRVCTLPCKTDQDCLILTSVRDPFVCAHRPSDGAGHCVTPAPFSGSPCLQREHCPAGLDCYRYDPYQTRVAGECRLPCGPAGACPARGGLPHVCLTDGDGTSGGCYPGRFGLPCTDSSQCMAGFACETVTAEVPAPVTQKVCTIPCAVDADCDANPWTQKAGYCAGGYCQLGGGDDAHCDREAHCRTRRCQLPPAGNNTCLPNPEP
jgi:hypothetical protein